MPRQLILNADDYGLSPAVSSGILLAMKNGVVRSTTAMANLATAGELAGLRDWLASDEGQTRRCSAGCHLNLSCGPALFKNYPQRLLRSGTDGSLVFSKDLALRIDTWSEPELLAAVAHEWELQLRALLESALPVRHLDSHHHVHMLRPLFPIALELAQRHGLALRTRRAYRSLARSQGVSTADTLVEGYFGAGSIGTEQLLKLVADAEGDCVEVMCHPGLLDDTLRMRSGYVMERQEELQALIQASLSGELAGQGWELAGYGWVHKSGDASVTDCSA